MVNLYDNLNALCKRKGMTPSGLCVELGISKTIVSKLKNNPEAQLSYKTAEKMAAYLGVPTEEVLHGFKKEKSAAIIDSGELNRKKIFAEMLSCLPERDRLVIEHNIVMLWRLAKAEGTLIESESAVDISGIIEILCAGRDRLLGGA